MDFLNRTYSQLLGLCRSMTPGSRLAAGLSMAAVLLGAGYLLWHRTAVPEVDLMRGAPIAAGQLPLMEAAFAKSNLTGYEIRGTSIFVPRGQEAAYMAALTAAKALPPNFGDALRDAVNEGTPFDGRQEREQRIKIAMQETLSQILCAMPGIERAYVLYDVDNKPGLQREKVVTATASVKPIGQSRLDADLIAEIRKFVACSIAGLKPENVTVFDLNGPARQETSAVANDSDKNGQLSAQRIIEQTPKANGPVQEPSPTSFRTIALDWLKQSWRMLALAGSGLLGLWLLHVLFRPRRTRSNEAIENAPESADDFSGGQPSEVPAPHARRFFQSSPAFRERLSATVEKDPDAAAGVLRSWIGQVG